MKTFVESLSISAGAILVAVLSVGVVWLLCSVLPVTLRSLWVVIVPFIFAYSRFGSEMIHLNTVPGRSCSSGHGFYLGLFRPHC
jgi:hypothetical protein